MTAALATDAMVLGATTALPAFVWIKWRPARTVPHPAGEFPKPTLDIRGPDAVLDGHPGGVHPLGRYGIDAGAAKVVMDG